MNSTTRFEIPIEPKEYNLFALDDYLRSISTPDDRQKLIRKVGYSPTKRAAYEKRRGLPHGAVELAMLVEDKRMRECNEKLSRQVMRPEKTEITPEELKRFYLEVDSTLSGMRALYPDAMQFMKNYAMLSQRNRSSFLGDYQTGNEFKIFKAAACPGPQDPCNPDFAICTRTLVYTDVLVALWFSIAFALDVAVLVVTIAAAVLWLFICAAVPVVIPPCILVIGGV